MEIGFSFCDEIEEEIMLRLPTKSLSRFNCVSKTWHTKINTSEFAHKHLERQRQTQPNNNLNLMLHGSSGPLQSVSNYYFDIVAKTIRQHNQPLLVNFIDNEKHRFNVVGSCDGLLLVVATTGFGSNGGDHVIYIWNPTTGQYKTLPQLMASYMESNVVFGFGPDLTTHNNNHYKVLVLETKLGDSDSGTFEFKVSMYMYTTHTNSWKTLPPNIGPYDYFTPHPKGMILAYDNLHYQRKMDNTEDDIDSILSFDLKDDKFKVLPSVPGAYLINLCNLNGDLCAFSLTDNDDNNIYWIWRMENFGVEKQECWTKMCSIDCCAGIDCSIKFITPLHFLEDGQILLHGQHKYPRPIQPFIIAYNIEHRKASFLVQANGSFLRTPVPVVYEESFISPNAASTAE